MTTSELRLLVDGIRYVESALAAPVDKDEVAAELAPMRALFGRRLRRALHTDEPLHDSDLYPLVPNPPHRTRAH